MIDDIVNDTTNAEETVSDEIKIKYKLLEPHDYYTKFSKRSLTLEIDINLIGIFIYLGRQVPQNSSQRIIKTLNNASEYIQKKKSDKYFYEDEGQSLDFYRISMLVKNPSDLDNVEQVITQVKNVLDSPPADKSERKYLSDILFEFVKKFEPKGVMTCYGMKYDTEL